jgi:hypothetical protein
MHATVVAPEACAWPVLSRLSPTRLGVVYFNRPTHGLAEGDLAALISDDGGRTWHEAGLPAPHEPGANRIHIATGMAPDGTWIVLSTGFTPRHGEYGPLDPLWCSRQRAGANTWEIHRDIAIGGTPGGVVPHGRILALPDGRLAAAFYRSWGPRQPSRSWIAFSEDGGASWGGAREVGQGDSNEVVLLRTSAGTLLAAGRTHIDHHVCLHASTDEGRTWNFRRDLTLPMQHPADLTDLGDEGLLLTYGIRNRGLMGIGLRQGRREGEVWGPPAVLYQFGAARDCGYPSTLSLGDGELLTACYTDLSPLHEGYHLLMIHWRLSEMFQPRPLRSMSDGRPLQA